MLCTSGALTTFTVSQVVSFDSTMNAIYEMQDKIKFIEVRHEEAGALAASAEYKLTGKLGVCMGSAGLVPST
jgi:thiamine pyrophosphate-dependent acetolactate synthase large subunit-like protein